MLHHIVGIFMKPKVKIVSMPEHGNPIPLLSQNVATDISWHVGI